MPPAVIPLARDQPAVARPGVSPGSPRTPRPTAAGDQPGQRREPQPVGRLVADLAGSGGAAPRSRRREHQEPGILGHLAPGQHHQAAEQAAHEQVADRDDHSAMISARKPGQARDRHCAPTKQRPFPHRRLCCPAAQPGRHGRLRRPHPASDPLPGSPVIGRHAPATHPQVTRAGEGLPSSRRHHRYVPRPIRRGVPHGCASRLCTASMAFALISGARHSQSPPLRARPLTTPQASRHATDRIVAPPYRAFDAGLRRRPVSRPDRQPATGPPGSYPDRTSTGRRRRAYEQQDPLLRHSVTSRSAGRTNSQG